jgi:hypothetical protein
MYRLSRPSATVRTIASTCLLIGAAAGAHALEFPETSYAAAGWMQADGERTRFEQHMDWERQRMRMAMTPEGDSQTTVFIYDMSTGRGLMFALGDDIPENEKMAIAIDGGDTYTYEQMRADYESMGDYEPLGERTVHGEDCTLYRSRDGSLGPGDEGEPGMACITDDGIVVQYLDAATDSAVLELTRVTRGTPDAAMFEVPAGYRQMDMGNLGEMFSGLMQAGEPEASEASPDAEAEEDGAGAAEAVREGIKGLFNRWQN